MNRAIAYVTYICWLVLPARSVVAAPDRYDALVDAIIAVEGVRDPAKVGHNGELGLTRMTPAVWAQHTAAPFAWCATNREWERNVAKKHLRWLGRELTKHRFEASPLALAISWNGGLSGLLHDTAPASAWDYGRRVANIVRKGAHE